MITIPLTSEQRTMLAAWIRREKDYGLSIKCIASHLVTPRVTGTYDSISDDLDFIHRVKQAVESRDLEVSLAEEDGDRLLACAQANRFQDKEVFWNAIVETLQALLT